ncbi:MAG TPA: PhnD/SsuA/transferrin family substrate-binding protein [Steroidobacteraceae bacterium]|nr:PhnD/SsuA/transferrin family substrate-binding protein [Steroidobacteraceae bacterium]
MSTLLAAATATLVFCAPGYPGGAGDAQPLVDRFAGAAVKAAGWPAGSLAAIYDPTDDGSMAKLAAADAALAFVPYPFFVQHGQQLHLTPLVQADVAGTGTQQRWTLVAKPGRVTGPASLAGYTIVSVAGYAPQFVRHTALESWPLAPDVKIQSTGQILSALRRVANGEQSVALLDQTQAAALPTLPFANNLEAVTQSPPVPVAIIAVVESRVPAARAKALQAGLLRMSHGEGAETLAALQLKGFILPQLPATP